MTAIIIVVCAVVLLIWATLVFVGDLECLEGTVLDDVSYCLTYGVASLAESIAKRALPGRFHGSCGRCEVREASAVGVVIFALLYMGSVVGVSVLMLDSLDKVSRAERALAVGYMLAVLASFTAACRSDPGIVTPANATQMIQLFPADGILRTEKACETCLLMRPARAKHHGGHCIAYFDHYCVWMGNVIGLFNMRYFLLFLLVTSAACAHGAIVGVRLLHRDIYVVRGWRPSFRVLLRILANRHQLLTALVAFLIVASVALFAFFATHLVQVLRGVTSYECIKLRGLDKKTRAAYRSRGMRLEMLRIILRPRTSLSNANKQSKTR